MHRHPKTVQHAVQHQLHHRIDGFEPVVKPLAADHGEFGRAYGANAGRPRTRVDQRHFADDLTRTQRRKHRALVVVAGEDFDRPLVNQISDITGIALSKDQFAIFVGTLLTRVNHCVTPRGEQYGAR